jgi:hypothetical protein
MSDLKHIETSLGDVFVRTTGIIGIIPGPQLHTTLVLYESGQAVMLPGAPRDWYKKILDGDAPPPNPSGKLKLAS